MEMGDEHEKRQNRVLYLSASKDTGRPNLSTKEDRFIRKNGERC